MQTWAKRGFQAALVTGGVLAAGTGVASATQTGPDQHPDQDGTPRQDPQSTGQFTEATTSVRTLSGQLDLVRDVLPAVQDAPTREMPALDAHGQPLPKRAARPVSGQHAAPDPDASTVRFRVDGGQGTRTVPLRRGQHGQHAQTQPRAAARGRHAAPVASTPSDGVHRSAAWQGPLGDVLRDAETGQLQPAGPQPDPVTDRDAAARTSPNLPVIDPQLGGLGGLVAPEAVDLTSGRLAPTTTARTVPHSVVASAAANSRPRPAPRSETVPLHVPGEHQEKATDVPSLAGSLLADREHGATGPAPSGRAHAPLSRITGALLGAPASEPVAAETVQFQRLPEFTDDPLALPATARQLDPLAAVKAEREHVADNPFRAEIGTRRAAAAGLERGMALPLLDGVTHRVLPELGGDGETTDVLPVLAGA